MLEENYEAMFVPQVGDGSEFHVGEEQFVIRDNEFIPRNTITVFNEERGTSYSVVYHEDTVCWCSCEDHYYRVHEGDKDRCKHQEVVSEYLTLKK